MVKFWRMGGGHSDIWAASWQNQQNGMCAQRRLRSAWASAQSGQSSRCPHKKAWVLSYPLSAKRRLWSDWADAQADLSLRWVHRSWGGSFLGQACASATSEWSLVWKTNYTIWVLDCEKLSFQTLLFVNEIFVKKKKNMPFFKLLAI